MSARVLCNAVSLVFGSKLINCECGKIGFVDRTTGNCPRCKKAFDYGFLVESTQKFEVKELENGMIQMEFFK